MTKEKQKDQDSSLNPETKKANLVYSEHEPGMTNMYSHGSGGGIDDEYYINEIIGIDEIRYDHFIKKPEPRLQRTEAQKNFFHLHHTTKEGK